MKIDFNNNELKALVDTFFSDDMRIPIKNAGVVASIQNKLAMAYQEQQKEAGSKSVVKQVGSKKSKK